MDRILKTVDWIIGVLMVILVVAMLAIGTAQVFSRYVLQSSLSWSEELMRFLYVWVVMIGINLGIRHRGLAAITNLTDYLEKKAPSLRHLMAFLAFSLQLLVFAVMFFYGAKLVVSGRQLSPAMRIPLRYIYLAIPLGSAMSLVYTAEEIRGYVVSRILKKTRPA